MQLKKKLSYRLFLVVRWFVWLFYTKMKISGAENLPEEPCIVVGNHAQMNGPLVGELYFPGKRRIWCAAQMMHWKEVPAYAYEDFWSHKPASVRWLYRLASYAITPLAVLIFNNARTLPVYRDARVVSTFRESVAAMQAGENLVIFPEHGYEPVNSILYPFQEGFVDTAALYCRRAKKPVSFVPLYIAPALKTACIGKPIPFDAKAPLPQERERICRLLTEEITRMARELPEHKVVPYRNIPRKDYPSNKDQ